MSTPQNNASEQLQQMFGALRSLLAEDTRAEGWGARLLELSEKAHGLDGQVWQEQWDPYIRDTSMNLPAPLLTLKSLEHFERAAALLPGCLFSLNLNSDEIGAHGAKALAQSPHLPSLSSLHLCRNNIGREGAEALAQSPHLSSLTSLDLWGNEIGDDGAKALARSSHLSSLSHLNLGGDQIGDEGARALAQSPYLTSLSYLDLEYNEIGEEGERALRESIYLSGARINV